jgi:glutamyl-Q tRNA(Asp) synthetase
MPFVTRFAPSPTGPLHLGHAYSALLAHTMARTSDGHFLLRIEDIDSTRSRPQWEQQIYDDLHWLGLTWDGPPIRQSDNLSVYQDALKTLWDQGLLYPCSCTRRDILAATSAPQEGAEPAYGPDGLIYPGTCRNAPRGPTSPMPDHQTLRLDMAAAAGILGPEMTLSFTETGQTNTPQTITFTPQTLVNEVGDLVLSRRDFLGSYHLCVVLDDAAQSITHVVRGRDIFDATQIHVLLQHLLNLPTPLYHHHALIRDEQGKRLAKRDNARSIATYREQGVTAQQVRAMIGLA